LNFRSIFIIISLD